MENAEPNMDTLNRVDGAADINRPAEPPLLPTGKPWGFWATLGLTAVILVFSLGAMFSVLLGVGWIVWILGDSDSFVDAVGNVRTNRIAMTFGFATGATVGLVLTAGFTRARKDITTFEYLALRPVRLRTLCIWLAVAGTAMAFAYTPVRIVELPTSKDNFPFLASVPYLTPGLALLTATYVQVLLWGFVYPGLASSRLGELLTVVAISLVVGCPYLLPEWDFRTAIPLTLLMMLSGIARIRTRSVYVPISMFVLWKSISATIAASLPAL